MKVLISPAKSIDMNRGIQTPLTTVANFLTEANQLVALLQKMNAEDLRKLMHISDDIAQMNVQRNKNWFAPTTPNEQVCPAIIAFTGEVYRGLDVATFSSADFEKAQNTIRILSGMYGILKPLDLLYPYRLEMGTRLAIDSKIKNLYQFWGTKLSSFLQNELHENEIVVNLASTEYSKAVPFKALKNTVITPVFKDFKNGQLKVVSVYAKHARGEMARWITINEIENIEDLKLYNGMGYQFDANQSTENEFTFTR